MKLSLILPLCALLASSALVACGGDTAPDAKNPGPTPTAPGPTATNPGPTPGAPRTLVTKKTMPTSPENLLIDPEFQSLWTPLDETGFGLYEAFVQDGSGEVRFQARTPAGPGVAALTVKAKSGAAPATLTMTVVGGKGPLAMSVWVSVPDGAAAPTVELASLLDQTTVALKADPASKQTIDGASWVAYKATSAKDMPGQLYLIGTVQPGAPVQFVAPEITSTSLVPDTRHAPPPASPRSLRAAKHLQDLRASHIRMAPPPRPNIP